MKKDEFQRVLIHYTHGTSIMAYDCVCGNIFWRECENVEEGRWGDELKNLGINHRVQVENVMANFIHDPNYDDQREAMLTIWTRIFMSTPEYQQLLATEIIQNNYRVGIPDEDWKVLQEMLESGKQLLEYMDGQ